ncbi:hypothetical protein J6590_044801 [Homalodisca vitripennis]|nr:hypothetical protein J6590_044801 [Homalodisca vitripennis]
MSSSSRTWYQFTSRTPFVGRWTRRDELGFRAEVAQSADNWSVRLITRCSTLLSPLVLCVGLTRPCSLTGRPAGELAGTLPRSTRRDAAIWRCVALLSADWGLGSVFLTSSFVTSVDWLARYHVVPDGTRRFGDVWPCCQLTGVLALLALANYCGDGTIVCRLAGTLPRSTRRDAAIWRCVALLLALANYCGDGTIVCRLAGTLPRSTRRDAAIWRCVALLSADWGLGSVFLTSSLLQSTLANYCGDGTIVCRLAARYHVVPDGTRRFGDVALLLALANYCGDGTIVCRLAGTLPRSTRRDAAIWRCVALLLALANYCGDGTIVCRLAGTLPRSTRRDAAIWRCVALLLALANYCGDGTIVCRLAGTLPRSTRRDAAIWRCVALLLALANYCGDGTIVCRLAGTLPRSTRRDAAIWRCVALLLALANYCGDGTIVCRLAGTLPRSTRRDAAIWRCVALLLALANYCGDGTIVCRLAGTLPRSTRRDAAIWRCVALLSADWGLGSVFLTSSFVTV